jgi:hypothetical protein
LLTLYPFVFASRLRNRIEHEKAGSAGTTSKNTWLLPRGKSENDYLLSEILMNPYTLPQLENIKISWDI